MSPQSYGVRAVGYPMEDMKPFGSIWNNGKISFMEDDTRTHLTKPADFSQAINLKQTRAVLQRNWGVMLTRRTPLFLFPIHEGSDHDHPMIRQDLEYARRSDSISSIGI